MEDYNFDNINNEINNLNNDEILQKIILDKIKSGKIDISKIINDKPNIQEYDDYKKTFELKNCKILYPHCYVSNDNILSRAEIKQSYEHVPVMYKGERKYFIDIWLKDSNIKIKDTIDYIPKYEGDNIYNLYKGIFASNIDDEPTDCNVILNHLKKLTNNDEASYVYLCKWLAQILQQPDILIGISLIFRSKQGAGKNIFFEYFGKMLGYNQYANTADIEKDIFDKHSTFRQNKLLISIDEANAKETFSVNDKIKNMITDSKMTLNPKNVKPYTINNYARLVFFTNNIYACKIEQSDRRFVVFDCDNSICKNKEYFDNLISAFKTPSIIKAFYNYLMNIDLTDFDPINERPITEAYMDMKEIPRHIEFLNHYLIQKQNTIIKIQSSDFYKKFKEYNNFIGINDAMTQTKYSLIMKNVIGVVRNRTMKGNIYEIDVNKCLEFIWEQYETLKPVVYDFEDTDTDSDIDN